jgi:hypothetical protein
MVLRFPSGELYFDAESKFALKTSNRTVEKTGNKGAKMYFFINNPKQKSGYYPANRTSKVYPQEKKWECGTRVMVRVVDIFKMMKFVHLQFERK